MNARELLQKVESWPADNIAAALITPQGVETSGDTSRRFEVASVTKLVVAYAIMLAVEEGVVELDQAAGPEGSTLRHLLAHASGIPFDSREPQKKVGERRIYSSAGYEWAADVVAAAAGMDFADYLQEGLCKPLGMTRTSLEGSAGHGLVSTVDDLVVFAQEVLEPKLLHSSTVEEMRTIQFPELRGVVPGYGGYNPCPWGLGFEIRGDKTPHWTGENMPAETIGHFGVSGTYLWIAESLAMVALTDHPFGDWAKPLWSDTNTAIWAGLHE
ncbi:MAG: serine hydrolase domain-containing protein [Corynebacterium sp.]|nr:serine hydrolase domain-containing protein [Corynebacterium sp.]